MNKLTNILNILYTPLDTDAPPKINIDKFLTWAYGIEYQNLKNAGDGSRGMSAELYPWHIVYARHSGKWQAEFDKEFPEIADFLCRVYGMSVGEIFSIVLLPVRTDFVGPGFWHADPDGHGLRVYLENDQIDDFLLIRPTVHPHNTRSLTLVPRDGIAPHIQTVEHSAKLLRPNQSFFINNIRAVHSANVAKLNSMRIACIISPFNALNTMDSMKSDLQDLILRSAEKYSDYAIHWTPPVK